MLGATEAKRSEMLVVGRGQHIKHPPHLALTNRETGYFAFLDNHNMDILSFLRRNPELERFLI